MHPHRRTARTVLAAAVVAAGLLALPVRAAQAGLVQTETTQLTARLQELTFTTPAMPGPTKVRVLLPAGYAGSAARYPVLYLLNGGGGSYLDWTTQGDAERITAHLPAIVVMPDGRPDGNYTDWYGTDANGFRPLWETYHLTQLLPWVDAHFRTIARRDQRVIAGLSMGGNGALHYAARHPDLFAGVASFSGANDVFQPLIRPITETTGIADGCLPGAVFGPSATEELRWRAFNPVDLAENLRGLWVSLAFGNGQPEGAGGVDPIEQAVHEANVTLHGRLLAANVPHDYDDYGAGAHSWPYWQRDLTKALPRIQQVFAAHRPAPAAVTHWSADPSYRVFGWSVHLQRPVAEKSYLRGATAKGFRVTGTGTGFVLTPPLYRVNQRITITRDDVSGHHVSTVVVGASRRIRVAVDLGAPNPFQQYTAQAAVTGTAVREARVVFS